MAYMKTFGGILIQNSFAITPIIPKQKRPALKAWQRTDIGAADVANYGAYGVGIRCGVGEFPVVAIDIDTTDEGLALEYETWCLDTLGDAPRRIGHAPKRLLVYRAESAGWSKASSPWLEDLYGDKLRLEILGAGQQFVAYGMHPDGFEYQWIDYWGGLVEFHARDLTMLSWGDVEQALAEWVERAELTGCTPVSPQSAGAALGGPTHESRNGSGRQTAPRDRMAAYEPPLGLSIPEADIVLRAGGGDAADYDAWLRAGMALHHEFAGKATEPDALQLWDDWSSGSPNYAGREDLEKRWDGFGRATAAGARAMTLKYAVKASAERGVKYNSAAAAQAAPDSDASDASAGADSGTADPHAGGPMNSALRYSRTEAGNAKRMVDVYGQDLRWCADFNQWYRWQGVHWRAVPLTELRHLAAFTVDALRDETDRLPTDKEKSDHLKWCAASQRWAMYDHMVSIASLEPHLWVRANQLDAQHFMLGCANGTVDLRTGVLLPPDRAHLITRITDVAYDPHATAPWFEQTVMEIFNNDRELAQFVQRLFGYILMGLPVEDLLIIFFGPGNNGKSTLLNAIRKTFGGHATTAAASTFMRDRGVGGSDGARPELLALAGKRLALVAEPDEGGELREGLVKGMTGGDQVPARALYSSTIVNIEPTWTVVMATNHKPIVRGDDYGIWRRLMLVPFERDFDHDLDVVKDIHREAKLLAELPGILAWCVKGAREYQRIGLCPPGAVEASRREYKSDMDLLHDWISERCTTSEEGASLYDLWLDWEPWARARGELRFVQSAKALKKRLANRGISFEKREKGQFAFGISLKSAKNDEKMV